jgi:hypothetical protein
MLVGALFLRTRPTTHVHNIPTHPNLPFIPPPPNTQTQLAKELGIKRVLLINDFVALGYGLLTVDRKNAKEVRVLQVHKFIFIKSNSRSSGFDMIER